MLSGASTRQIIKHPLRDSILELEVGPQCLRCLHEEAAVVLRL